MKIAKRTRFITYSASIAAVYVVLTYLTNALGLANGAVQCRLSEAMCVLPAFTGAAVPGLFIGCLISNLLTGCVILDVIFGSLATLIGAYGTFLLKKFNVSHFLFPLPPIIANTLIIPFLLKYAYSLSGGLWYFVLTVGAGEVISCGILGILLYRSIYNKSHQLFRY